MAIRTDFATQSLIDEEIDAEIKRHEQTMKALNTRRNIYCAVNQLPNDVLTSIFTAVQREARASEPPYHVVFTNWIAISHVCQAWHALVVNNPRFWSCIDLNSNQVSRMLALSNDSPLEVLCRIPRSASERFWSLVAATMSQNGRLESLSMDVGDPDAFPRLLAMIPSNSSAPQMRQLDIRASGQGELPGNIWADMPSLRELIIKKGPLPPRTHFMPQLTNITISARQNDGQATSSLLLDILMSSPNLQKVVILGFHGPLVDPQPPRASLPCLYALYTTTNDPLNLCIFNHIDAPCLTTLLFEYTGAETTMFTTRSLSGLKALISQVMSPPIPINKVEMWITDTFRLSISDKSDARYVNCKLPFGLPEVLLLELCDLPPLHKASLLCLNGIGASYVAPQPLSFIRSYAEVETMVLRQPSLQILQTMLKRDAEQRPPHVKLVHLRIDHTYFRTIGDGESPVFHLLMRILRERTQYMIPIKKVVLYQCHILDTSLEELSRLVEVVHGHSEG